MYYIHMCNRCTHQGNIDSRHIKVVQTEYLRTTKTNYKSLKKEEHASGVLASKQNSKVDRHTQIKQSNNTVSSIQSDIVARVQYWQLLLILPVLHLRPSLTK